MGLPRRRIAQNVVCVAQEQKEDEDKCQQADYCGNDEGPVLLGVSVFREAVIELVIIAIVIESRH